MIINRLRMPISQARAIEDMNASVQKQQADIEYVAMMTDIDIPTEDESAEDSKEEE